jgi:transcriptional regulator with XRE-family HTH domain
MSFYDNLKNACENKGLKVSPFIQTLGLNSANTGAWKNGGFPRAEKLIEIADALDVSVDYLLGRETKKEPTVIPNTNKNPEVQQIIHKLTTFEVPDDVIEFINNALDAYKNK